MGAGKGDRVVLVLVEFDHIDEVVEFVTLGRADLRMEYVSNSGKSSLVFLLRTYGFDGCHFRTP